MAYRAGRRPGAEVPCLEVDLAWLDELVADSLAVLSSAHVLVGHRALIEAEGGDYGLDGTVVAEQGEHESHDVHTCTQAVEGRARGFGKGPAAGSTLVAPLLLAEHPDVAWPDPPSVRSVRVVAELSPRVL